MAEVAFLPLAEWLEREVQRRGRSPLIVAGSVVATEEPLALIAFGTLQGEHRNALLVLAPRKPERFDAAAQFIDESHRKFIRRSQLAIPSPSRNGQPQTSRMTDGSLVSVVQVVVDIAGGGHVIGAGLRYLVSVGELSSTTGQSGANGIAAVNWTVTPAEAAGQTALIFSACADNQDPSICDPQPLATLNPQTVP